VAGAPYSVLDAAAWDQLATWCRPVPAAGPGVCRLCRGCPRPGWALCWSCARVLEQVRQPCPTVAPITLYEVGSSIHGILRGYKDSASAVTRRRHQSTLRALMGRFLSEHQRCVTAGAPPWDLVTTVPSTTGRPGLHPLAQILEAVPGLASQHQHLLAWSGQPLGHLEASDQAFRVTHPVERARVLVLDDTWTSGSRAQSAASALALAGARVAAVVVAGRVIQPSSGRHVGDWWANVCGQPFSFEVCALEVATGPSAIPPGSRSGCWARAG
jgi:predicted amidophosphoribosyltransferase